MRSAAALRRAARETLREILLGTVLALGAALVTAPAPAEDRPGPGEPLELEVRRVETVFGPVYVGPEAPGDHYAERWPDGVWWVPGNVEGTSLVRKVIRAARAARDRGRPLVVRRVQRDGVAVWLTPEPPFAGVHTRGAGDAWAWIAGVAKPDAAQREALGGLAAVGADPG